MEEAQTDAQTPNNSATEISPVKLWHAPAVRWLDVRETRHGISGSNDGGTSGSFLS